MTYFCCLPESIFIRLSVSKYLCKIMTSIFNWNNVCVFSQLTPVQLRTCQTQVKSN